MSLDVAEDVVRPSGSVSVVGEAGASILDSSVPSLLAGGSRPVRAGKLNSFIDRVIHCFPSFQLSCLLKRLFRFCFRFCSFRFFLSFSF